MTDEATKEGDISYFHFHHIYIYSLKTNIQFLSYNYHTLLTTLVGLNFFSGAYLSRDIQTHYLQDSLIEQKY